MPVGRRTIITISTFRLFLLHVLMFRASWAALHLSQQALEPRVGLVYVAPEPLVPARSLPPQQVDTRDLLPQSYDNFRFSS